jgi:cellulose synthase/poly-beta-1,6-N-acetylglucosamine synthase-like glycosyltransferase
VGGWSGDTLTEDLDLSYRAQLAGWKLDYCLDLACPAELPGTVNALKSQQRRWATGSIQVARKLLPRIWRSPVSIGEKIEATLHLTHYSVSLWMLLLALVARPLLLVVFADSRMFSDWAWLAWGLIYFAALAPSLVYIYARHSLGGKWTALRTIPGMMILGCGLCVNNTLAVLRGLTLRGGEFIRTPKSGSVGVLSRQSSYNALHSKMWMIEIGLGLYSLASFIVYMTAEYRAFSVFLLLYAVGLCLAGWMSRPLRFQSPNLVGELSADAAPLRAAVYEP